MKWQRIPLLYVLAVLVLVAQLLAHHDGLVRADLQWWKDRAKAARGDEEGVSLSCWRKGSVPKAKTCPQGYKMKNWLMCTANCPLEMPVRCGAMCLAPGESCAHDVAKKLTVTGMFAAKALGVGLTGLDEACKIFASFVNTKGTRRLQTVAQCDEHIKALSAMKDDEFADLVMAVFPDDVKKKSLLLRSRRLDPFTCAARIIDAVKAIATAYGAAMDKKTAAEKEAVFAATDALASVNTVVSACGVATGLDEGIMSLLEVLVKGATERIKEKKEWSKIAAEMGLTMLARLDPVGIVAFAHEFIHGFCPLDYVAAEGVAFDADIAEMGPDISKLAFTQTGSTPEEGPFTVLTGSYKPKSTDPAKKGKLVLKITNRLAANVKLKAFAGGRAIRQPTAADGKKGDKVVEYLGVTESTATITVDLDQVREQVIRLEVLADKNIAEKTGDKIKTLINRFVAKLGKKNPLFVVNTRKFGEFQFWAPKGDAKDGELEVIGQLAEGPLKAGHTGRE